MRPQSARPIAAGQALAYTENRPTPAEPAVRTTREELIREYRNRGWWSDTRITDLFDAAARAVPSQFAVLDPPNRESLVGGAPLRLTFSDVADLADGYAIRLRELGLGRDDILVTQLPNIAEYPAIYLAALRLGIIVSPVPMQFRRHELEQIVDLTGARATLTVRALKGVDYAADAVQLGAGRKLLALCLGDDAPAGSLPFMPTKVTPESRAALQRHVAALGVSADDVATVCWTSGTEGMPKGVPRTHNHWIAISYGHLRGAGIRRGERLLNPFPLINMAAIGGCFMSWLHSAGHTGAASSAGPRGLPAADRRRKAGIRNRTARRAQHAAEGREAARERRPLLPALHRVRLRAARPGDDPRVPGTVRHRDRQHVRLQRRHFADEQRVERGRAGTSRTPVSTLRARRNRVAVTAVRQHTHAPCRSRNGRRDSRDWPARRNADHRPDRVRRLLPRARDHGAVVHGGWLVPHGRPVRNRRG